MDAQTPTPPPSADDDGGGMLPPVAKLKLLSDIRLDQMPLVDRVLLALEAVTLVDVRRSRDAGRLAERIRFALARVDELQRSAGNLGSVFEPARLEVAESILAAHIARATAFVEAVVTRGAKSPRRAAAPDVAASEPSAKQQRAA